MAIYVDRRGGDVAIWSNPEKGRSHAGRCIGVGPTLALAKLDAIDELNADMADVLALEDSAGDAGDDDEEAG